MKMKMIKMKMNQWQIILALIFVSVAICDCQYTALGGGSLRKTNKTSFLNIREKLINKLAKNMGYDTEGWIDFTQLMEKKEDGKKGEGVENGLTAFNTVDIKLQDNEIICNSENTVVPVRLKEEHVRQRNDLFIYSECDVDYKRLEKGSHVLKTLPLFVKKEFLDFNIGENPKRILPEKFNGYLVCKEKGAPAVLIPDTVEPAVFVAPPWRVRVTIQVYSNVLARFGRQYRILILDNVKVLKNGKTSFFWPIPLSNFTEVYDFQQAIEGSKYGKFCTLSRDDISSDVILECDKWKVNISHKLVNGLFALGFTMMNVANAMFYPVMKPNPVLIRTVDLQDGQIKILFDERQVPEGEIANNVEEDLTFYKQDRSFRRKLIIGGNLIYLTMWAIVNGFWNVVNVIKISRQLKKINDELKILPPAYPWVLRTVSFSSHEKHL